MGNAKKLQSWISNVRLGAARAALTVVVVFGLGVVATPRAQAGTFTVLHNFTGTTDGGNPYADMVADTEGNFYSTASGGGTSGKGVVFKMDARGKETVLYTF